ncbi:hypothetical protein E3N88_35227 [Mikania micrantha]|uniref:WRKY19-like zinc finger domain-containing protein n=1 Tax=Mikania micrantha TaxID=192012 RepID=A0A5N6M0E1_9ASTR|nr:hypothetical protein E3N88_35227 [Mikania micrantha]
MVYSNPKMDLNNSLAFVSCNGNSNTSLSLDCFGYGGNMGSGHVFTGEKPMEQNSNCAPDDGCRLVLGLGPTPSAYSKDYYSYSTKKPASVSVSNMGLSCEDGDSVLKLGLSDHSMNDASCYSHKVIDEGSTSAKKSGGYMPSLLLAPRHNLLEPGENSNHGPQLSSEPSAISDYSISDHQTSNSRKCKFDGCTKGARGATGLCIGHGGGQRCQKLGCNKGAESRTAYCKAHGGGRRCQHLGCTKSAEGRTEFCIAHGGGRRCGHPSGCSKAARGKSGLCIKHGGGKRCKMEGCTRSAEGQIGLCISHGGGRRCQFQGCSKGAQGSTMYCKAHGGGKRCIFAGCTKGAEGSTPLCKAHGGGKRCLHDGGGICPKSVHGGTNFCVAHGGGKRCSVAGCTKSARGRTDCCVKHGGGKRCKSENCTKSAQGSTDFCKAHGGGKRCNWGGEGKCEKFARGKSGLCAAHATMVQEKEASITKRGAFGIGPGLFHGVVQAPASTIMSSFENTYSSSGVSIVSDSIDSRERPAKRQHLIPPQVLVPLSMKSPFSSSFTTQLSSDRGRERRENGDSRKSLEFVVPEGRVHGGGLLSLLGGNLKNATIDGV